MKRVRVLVIDDSATMRAIIIDRLQRDPRIEIVAQAVDAHSAREAIKKTNPDVATLDIEMPSMNGLEFLERLMRLRSMPVLMVSSLTKRNATATFKAIEAGAVDCIAKPSRENPNAFDDLPIRVIAASKARLRVRTRQQMHMPDTMSQSASPHSTAYMSELIAIGASMGGIDALMEILSQFPVDCPPTVIVQHMPEQFTLTFAQRLNRISAATVAAATPGAPLETGTVYLATDTQHHLCVTDRNGLKCTLRSGPPEQGHRPSIDVLFRSVADVAGSKAVGVILTGMGRDGASGLLEMREAGARTIGQDEHTSTIYGMPKAAFDVGAVGTQLPLHAIPTSILSNV